MEEREKDWKLKLQQGKLQTPFKHIAVIAEGIAGEIEGFNCPPGSAYMSMKTWASSDEEAADMFQAIGKHIGFEVTGDIQLYYTEPNEPPTENAYGYDIKFTPFS